MNATLINFNSMEYNQFECKTLCPKSTGPTLVLPQVHASIHTYRHSTLARAITRSFSQLVQCIRFITLRIAMTRVSCVHKHIYYPDPDIHIAEEAPGHPS